MSTTLALHYKSQKQIIGMESTKFATTGINHVFSRLTVSKLWRVEVKYLVPMSVQSLLEGLLLVLLRTHCQAAVLMLLLRLRTHCQAAVLLLLLLLRTQSPGGSFMEINTDMKKALRGGYTFVYLDATPNTKRKKRQGILILQVS